MLVATTCRSFLPRSSLFLSSLPTTPRLSSITIPKAPHSPLPSSSSLIQKRDLYTFVPRTTPPSTHRPPPLATPTSPLSPHPSTKSKVFSGWVFAITGTFSRPREEIVKLIEQHGGEVKGKITNQVNVLLATPVEIKEKTVKVLDAEARKIPIVRENFLQTSIEKGEARSPGRYKVVKPVAQTAVRPPTPPPPHPPPPPPPVPAVKPNVARPLAATTPKKETKKAMPVKNANNSVWSWKDRSGWVNYDFETTSKIEKEYLEWVKSDKKHHGEIGVDKERFIDFSRMVQRRFDDPRQRREVRREFLA